ncbi:MAG: DUF6498-containing protein [Hyphomonadaceae bacterium]
MRLLDPEFWRRRLTNPKVIAGMVVDSLPIVGVLLWGWGAAPLVLLYWMENLIIGVMTLPRLVLSGVRYGALGIIGGAGMALFFTFHYGLFCYVHGVFLSVFFAGPDFSPGAPGLSGFMDMIRIALTSGEHLNLAVYTLVAWHFLMLMWDFGVRGEWRRTTPVEEMVRPYQRVVVLHIGLFVGAGALIALGDPMIGVLGLILLRVLWGIVANGDREAKSTPEPSAAI